MERHIIESSEPRREYKVMDSFIDKETLQVFKKYDIVECTPEYAKNLYELIPNNPYSAEYSADEWNMVLRLLWHHLEHRTQDRTLCEELHQKNKALKAENTILKGVDIYKTLESLKAELAAARQQIAELTAAQPAPEDAALTSQQKASLVRQENTLNAWKPAIDAMVKVAVACGEEGKKLRQQPDLNILFNEIDAELIDAQMEFFRHCLPDDHIDRIGGPNGKS